MYIETIPSGFSAFCTLDEKRIVARYITINANNQKEDRTERIKKEPRPVQEHTYCHLCKVVYKDYIAHLDTKTHKSNMIQNQKIYDEINCSFKRIRTFWKDIKITENNESEEERDIVEYIPKGSLKRIMCGETTQSTNSQSVDWLFEQLNVAYVKKTFRKKRKSNEIGVPSNAILNLGENKYYRNYFK